jgi:hypothetical protein
MISMQVPTMTLMDDIPDDVFDDVDSSDVMMEDYQ